MVRELLLPSTDLLVLIETIAAVVVFGGLLYLFRNRRDARFLTGASAFFTFAFFGLRAMH